MRSDDFKLSMLDPLATRLARTGVNVREIRTPRFGEKSRTLFTELNFDEDEFGQMTVAEYRDVYLRELVFDDIINPIKRIEKRLQREVEFRRFRVPAETANRKVFTLEKNGVFVVLMIHPAAEEMGGGRLRKLIRTSIQAVIGLAAEDLPLLVKKDKVKRIPKKISKFERFRGVNQG